MNNDTANPAEARPVTGFTWGGIDAGIKPAGIPDFALIASDRPAASAGVFTTNRVKAACVTRNQTLINSPVRAVVVNSGNANAVTGADGDARNAAMAAHTADTLGCTADEVLTLSTGVIGVPLPIDAIRQRVPGLAGSMRADGIAGAAQAIITTDTRPKAASAVTSSGVTITGIAKGSGMIAPNMATMLAVITTDAAIMPDALQALLADAVRQSFNRIVVDGDMSTNDTVLMLANGAAGVEVTVADTGFAAALLDVCGALAQAIVKDGEGATKFVTLEIGGAASQADARAVGHAIATSPLCKTAFYGADPNWGRLLAAAGRSGVPIDPARVSLWLFDDDGHEFHLLADGAPLEFDEPAAIEMMTGDAWGFRMTLGMGDQAATLWTCDLSHGYVSINAEYRT